MSVPKGKTGDITIGIPNYSNMVKKLQALNKDSEIAMQRTVNDFKSRAPAWVSAGVTEHYTIKKSEVKGALTGAKKGVGTVKVKGITVDNVQLEYSGRLLTPTHFKMKPTKPPEKRAKEKRLIPGGNVSGGNGAGDVATVLPPAPYTVTAEIIKGQRKSLGDGTFLGTNKGDGYIPFQRTGEGRTPIASIKTVSIPQMITGKGAESIQAKIDEGLTKRLEHHTERLLK